ncbi:MAG: arylsulfatase, partial [Parvularculaceae bacterium]|nr:arylsulfatase [Parvularculaceae bacterium]
MKRLIPFLAAFGLVACAEQGAETATDASADGGLEQAEQVAVAERPNFLIILADDLGFSDIGPFGGEVNTPHLDALAERGLRFSNFHTHMFCTPTRAMLLTGVNNHAAGIGTMAGEWRGTQKGSPGYETYLSDRVVTVARLLNDAGYFTTVSGKWDLGGRNDDALLPDRRGFEDSFVLVEGSADHFRNYPALAELPNVNYRERGADVAVPESFFSSTLYADKLIEQLEGQDDDRPFFAYLSFTAPHYPIQAPDEYIAKYDGVYEEGYEAIRQARLERMKAEGLMADDVVPADPHEAWPSWDELSDDYRAFEIRRMQVYAAMIDSMDHEIGRVMAHLEESGQLDNTVVIFLSDNGAEGGNPLDWAPYYYDWAEENFDLSLGNLGRPNSYAWTGPQWSHVSSAPYRLFKSFSTRGGTQSPLIMALPNGAHAGEVTDHFVRVDDIPATLLEWAGVDHPGTSFDGRDVVTIQGKSLAS